MTSPREEPNIGSYDAAFRAFARMNQDMANLRMFLNPPYLDAVNQLANTMEQVRLQQIEMSQAWMSSVRDSVAHLSDISNSSQHIYGMFTQTGVALVSLNQVHDSWIKRISDITAYRSQLDAVAKSTLFDCSIQLAATESILAGFDFNVLKSHYDFSLSTISAMERSIFDATASYRTLAESIPDLSEIVQMPSFVLPGATYDLYTAGQALKVLDPLDHPIDEEIETEVSIISVEYAENLNPVTLLKQVDPELVPLYSGAREDLYGDNPDRKRHVLVSLRELWIHLLDTLAPKRDVLDWLCKHGTSDDLDSKGGPKRHAKIRYILRSVSQKPLAKFVRDDAAAFENLYQLYHRLHEKTPNLTDKQLLAIFRKTEVSLSFLIQTWASSTT